MFRISFNCHCILITVFTCIPTVVRSAYYLQHICLYTCISVATTLDGYPWNLILATVMKVSRGNPNLVKKWEKKRQVHNLCKDLSMFHCCRQHNFATKAFLSGDSFMLITVTCRSTVHTNCTGVFPLQQWVFEHTTVSCIHTYTDCLLIWKWQSN